MPDLASFRPPAAPAPTTDEVADGGPESDSAEAEAAALPALNDPSLFLNREMSWLAFNERVLGEARDAAQPLLERVKFVAIAHANLDEYYMVRVSGLQQQVAAGMTDVSPDGMTSGEQLTQIRARVGPMLAEAAALWGGGLKAELGLAGIEIADYAGLSRPQQRALRALFERDVFPVLTPLALGPGHPFPHISNLSLNLAVAVRDPDLGERFARMKVPGVLPRLVACPPDGPGGGFCLVWLEQVIAANLESLFPGLQVTESYPFRVTRDADLEIQEDDAADLLQTVEQGLRRRQFGDVARLEVTASMPARVRALLVDNLLVDPADVYALPGPLGLSDLMDVWKLDRPDLKDSPFVPATPAPLAAPDDGILDVIGAQDVLLHHPFDSFVPILDFIKTASTDPHVLAVKQTLYRVGSNSPIVKSLAAARDDDTQVAVLVELKARFDEENNIEWARALEESGVHVVYGLVGLKTHCKIALVVRRERDGVLRRYAHLGTGNYNPTTARVYTDLSLFTARPDIAADLSELFNHLTGYSRQRRYRKLLVAPVNMRERLMQMIAREAEWARRGRPARLILKTNTLSDTPIIRALYAAAQAGVRIDLIVRGACCLRPGVPGVSENIRVVSVIGRFLEHSRIYYFHNAGRSQIYLGSADLMRRNLDRRVEVLFPVEDPALKRQIHEDLLENYLRDNAQAHELQPDGRYVRLHPAGGDAAFSVQDWLLARHGTPRQAE
jgi:polyphosphate kinase